MDEPQDDKSRALREHAALHPKPERVHDPLFQGSEFFDPRDLVLVKYEMIRRVRVDQRPATEAARSFGFSRVALYQAMEAFRNEGLPGLLPRRRGPKAASKLTEEVLAFIDLQRAGDSRLKAPALAKMVQQHFGLLVHPRSVERALARRAQVKKGRHTDSS